MQGGDPRYPARQLDDQSANVKAIGKQEAPFSSIKGCNMRVTVDEYITLMGISQAQDGG